MFSVLAVLYAVTFIPHPWNRLCLYKYTTTFKQGGHLPIITYDIVKMATVCVDANSHEEWGVLTTRRTMDEGDNSVETNKRLRQKMDILQAITPK